MDTYRGDRYGALVEYPPPGPFNGFPPFPAQGGDYPPSPHGYMPPTFSTPPPPGLWGAFYPPPTSPGGAPSSPHSPMYSGMPFGGAPPMYKGYLPPRPDFVSGTPPEDIRRSRRESESRDIRDRERERERERDKGRDRESGRERERERRRSKDRDGNRERDSSRKRDSRGPFSGLMHGSGDSARSSSIASTTRRASQRAIDELTRLKLSELADSTCSMCLGEMVERKYSRNTSGNEHPLRMPCGHVFGAGCLKSHLSKMNNCPACGYELETVEDGDKMRERRPSMRSNGSRSSRYSDEFHGLPMVNAPPPRAQTTRQGRGPFDPPPQSHYGNGPNPLVRPMTGFLPHNPHPMGQRIQSHRHSRFPSSSYAPPPPANQRYDSSAPFNRPHSASSSTAATTQSAPEGVRYPAPLQITAGPSGRSHTPFRRPDLECGFKETGLCEKPSGGRLVRLDCNHGYHYDCLRSNMASSGRGTAEGNEVWCEMCRKYKSKSIEM